MEYTQAGDPQSAAGGRIARVVVGFGCSSFLGMARPVFLALPQRWGPCAQGGLSLASKDPVGATVSAQSSTGDKCESAVGAASFWPRQRSGECEWCFQHRPSFNGGRKASGTALRLGKRLDGRGPACALGVSDPAILAKSDEKQCRLFQKLAKCGEELCTDRTINHPMVAGERQCQALSDHDAIFLDHRLLDCGADG